MALPGVRRVWTPLAGLSHLTWGRVMPVLDLERLARPLAWAAGVAVAVLGLAALAAGCGPTASAPRPAAPAAGPQPPLAAPSPPAVASPWATAIPSPPDRDLRLLAQQLLLGGERPPSLGPGATGRLEVGREELFWVMSLSPPGTRRVAAVLQRSTPAAHWYVEKGLAAEGVGLERLAQGFEAVTYPALLEAYGGSRAWARSASAPMAVVVARLEGAAGYFSGADLQPAEVFRYSNQRPAIYVDAGILTARQEDALALLAHEAQHLLHYYADPTEESWVNEGLASLAPELVGLPPSRRVPVQAPAGLSLTLWPALDQGIGRYYDSALLFFRYLLQHYGGIPALPLLLEEQGDGVEGVEAFLERTGAGASFRDVFLDWAVANLLGQEGPGRLGYGREGPPVAPATPRRALAPGERASGSVAPFATDYVALSLPPGGGVVRFQGDATVPILPEPPPGGGGCWWSNRGDSVHTRLQRGLDLRGLAGATLRFDAWYRIEEGWDWAYVAVSADGGATWRALQTTRSTLEDPVGPGYGPGLTGESGGWVREEADLSAYAGGEVLLGFHYVTDDAINLDGLCVTGVAVPEAGVRDGPEGPGVWESHGFAWVAGPVPQGFGVRLVTVGDGGRVEVRDVPLDQGSAGSLAVGPPFGGAVSATLVVSSLTRHTGQPASYTVALDPAP